MPSWEARRNPGISNEEFTEGRKANHINSSPNHILLIFSSEPPRNPRPFNIIFFKCPILENKCIFKNMATLGHKTWLE